MEMSFPYKVDQNSLVFSISAKGTFVNKIVLTLTKDSLVLIPENRDKLACINDN